MAAILAVHAHPDDVETLGAGALAALAKQGHAITIVTVTAGECGSSVLSPSETGRVRKHEAQAAAALIGAVYRCADIPDLAVFNDNSTRRAITEIVRWARPDIVVTASPRDYHPDHEATSLLVRDACFAAPIANYVCKTAAPLPAIPHLYFMDPIGGRDRDGQRIDPEFGADIEAFIDVKRAMLAAHASQQTWVSKQHGVSDHLSAMEEWGRRRGQYFGVNFAEGFRQYKHHPYPRTPALQDLLGALLVRAPR